MNLHIKTGGLLGRHLPPGSKRNSGELEAPAGSTVVDVLAQLGMPEGEQYFIAVNGEIVPPDARSARVLANDDNVSIMPPLKGG